MQAHSWQEINRSQLLEQMRGQLEIGDLTKRIIAQLCSQVFAELGALYCVEESTDLVLIASYASTQNIQASNRIAHGEGLLGQAAKERRMILVTEVPEDYYQISSALGQTSPRCVLLLPIATESELVGMIELCSLRTFSDQQISYLKSVAESIAVTIQASQYRLNMETLLGQTKQEIDLLQSQKKEFLVSVEDCKETAQV